MKLNDWPIAIRDSVPEVECLSMVPSQEAALLDLSIPEYCGMSLSVSDPSVGHNGRTAFEAGSFGQLAQSIVEHARTEHGVEIEPTGTWYRSFTPDGKLWSESSSVDDYGPVDVEGLEGEELEWAQKRNGVEKTLRYQRIRVYILDVAEEWKPDGQ